MSVSSLLSFWCVLSRLGWRRTEKEEEAPVSMNLTLYNSPFIIAADFIVTWSTLMDNWYEAGLQRLALL